MQLFRNISFDSSIKPVSGNEVRKIVKHLKPNKAPGHNRVTNITIKQLPYHFVKNLGPFEQHTEVAVLSSQLEESRSGENSQAKERSKNLSKSITH